MGLRYITRLNKRAPKHLMKEYQFAICFIAIGFIPHPERYHLIFSGTRVEILILSAPIFHATLISILSSLYYPLILLNICNFADKSF